MSHGSCGFSRPWPATGFSTPPGPGHGKAPARPEQADEILPGYLSAKVKVREQDVDNLRDVRS